MSSCKLLRILGTEQMISNIGKVPTGVKRWRLDIVLSDRQLIIILTFARVCSSSVFDHVFQYKSVTQIGPGGVSALPLVCSRNVGGIY